MPFDNIQYLPSLLPCTLQIGSHPPWHATLLHKEDNTLWAIKKIYDDPIPFCQFLGDYFKIMVPHGQIATFDAMLEYVTIPPYRESFATILRTYSVHQIRHLHCPPGFVLPTTTMTIPADLNPTPNPNTILSVASTQAILERLKAKNAELQAHFDLLTEAATLKERNQFIEASIRQLAAKLDS